MIQVQWLELGASDPGILVKPIQSIQIPQGSTVGQMLLQIGVDKSRADSLLRQRAVAVFGVYATEATVLHDGDRLEILDALKFDPMESRRRRARHKVLSKRQKELAKHARRSLKQGKSQG